MKENNHIKRIRENRIRVFRYGPYTWVFGIIKGGEFYDGKLLLSNFNSLYQVKDSIPEILDIEKKIAISKELYNINTNIRIGIKTLYSKKE
jgi:hypothetical protein